MVKIISNRRREQLYKELAEDSVARTEQEQEDLEWILDKTTRGVEPVDINYIDFGDDNEDQEPQG